MIIVLDLVYDGMVLVEVRTECNVMDLVYDGMVLVKVRTYTEGLGPVQGSD